MSKKRRPGSFLLPLIAKILAERIGDDVEQLSDAELLRSMAQGLSRHDDEFPLIACALAVGFERGPNEAEDLGKVADLLADMGLELYLGGATRGQAQRSLCGISIGILSRTTARWVVGCGSSGAACGFA